MSAKAGKVFGGIFLAPLVLIALGVAYCEANKAYWDHKVKELCEKDGGVTVFEKVELLKSAYPAMQVTSSGAAILPTKKSAKPDDQFFISYKDDVLLHAVNPSVWRGEMHMIRRFDNKILAKYISYTRRGGDFPTGILHDSSYSCDNYEKNVRLFESTISIKD